MKRRFFFGIVVGNLLFLNDQFLSCAMLLTSNVYVVGTGCYIRKCQRLNGIRCAHFIYGFAGSILNIDDTSRF